MSNRIVPVRPGVSNQECRVLPRQLSPRCYYRSSHVFVPWRRGCLARMDLDRGGGSERGGVGTLLHWGCNRRRPIVAVIIANDKFFSFWLNGKWDFWNHYRKRDYTLDIHVQQASFSGILHAGSSLLPLKPLPPRPDYLIRFFSFKKQTTRRRITETRVMKVLNRISHFLQSLNLDFLSRSRSSSTSGESTPVLLGPLTGGPSWQQNANFSSLQSGSLRSVGESVWVSGGILGSGLPPWGKMFS